MKQRRFPQPKTPIKLNIGSGGTPIKGYLNIDNRDVAEMVWDVRDGLPFPDSSVEEIVSSHFLEHLTDPESFEFLREALRVLEPKGKLSIRVPHSASYGAFYPGHLSFWNEHRVEAITRLEVPLPKFVLIHNEVQGEDLVFIMQKL